MYYLIACVNYNVCLLTLKRNFTRLFLYCIHIENKYNKYIHIYIFLYIQGLQYFYTCIYQITKSLNRIIYQATFLYFYCLSKSLNVILFVMTNRKLSLFLFLSPKTLSLSFIVTLSLSFTIYLSIFLYFFLILSDKNVHLSGPPRIYTHS